jgi:O-antigen ligase
MKSLSFSRILFLAGIAIIPFVYSTTGIDPAFTLRAILLSVLTIVTIFATRNQTIRTSPLLWIWYAYALFNIISIFVAQNSGEAIYQASIVLLYGAWLFAAIQMTTKEVLPSLLRTITLIGFAVSFISLFQFFDLGFGFIPGGVGPFATMTTKNLMSSFLFLTLPATLYIAMTEKKELGIFGLLTLTMSIFVLLITQTRAVWLGCGVAALVACAFFVLSTKRSSLWELYRRNILNAAIAVGACLIAIFVFNVAPRTGSHEISASEKVGSLAYYTSDTSANMRLTVWKESLEMLNDHPVLGVGAGNWKIQLPSYGLQQFPRYIQDGSYQWTETHNDFLEAFCETGIISGLAYLAFFVAAIVFGIRSAALRSTNSHEILLAILITAGICGFGVISFFDFPNARVEHSMLFLLWISLFPILGRNQKNAKNKFAVYLFILLVLPALTLSVSRFIAEEHEKSLLQARIDQDWNTVISECNKIYDPRLLSLDALSTPLLYYKAEAEFMQQNYDAALRDNLMALKAHPNHFYTLNNTGSAYIKTGNFQDGKVFYEKALAISPNFEESLLNLTVVFFNSKQYDNARMFLNRCDTTQPGSRAQSYARALRNIGH